MSGEGLGTKRGLDYLILEEDVRGMEGDIGARLKRLY